MRLRLSTTRAFSHSGDTIVEVLIAIMIISSILVGAYLAVNNSLTASQDSLERSVGTKLAEAQLERLKSVSDDEVSALPSADPPTTYRVFCMDATSNARQDFVALGSIGSSLPPMGTDTSSNYPPSCIVDNANNPYDPASRSTQYYVSIERDSANHHQYIARARWQGTGNKGIQEASVAYRVY